jgi:hypothetical protein
MVYRIYMWVVICAGAKEYKLITKILPYYLQFIVMKHGHICTVQ